jgi:hypothetical protein
MKNLLILLIATACAVAATAATANYSTEATITQQKEKGRFLVEVRVSQLVEQDGNVTEHLIARPRIDSAPGVPASLYSGLSPSHPNYDKEENVTVDVSWPEAGMRGFAICDVTVKLGNKVVSRSRMKMEVENR